MKRIKKSSESLACKLTQDELLSYGREISEKSIKRAELEAKKAAEAKLIKESIDGLNSDVRNLAHIVRAGEEFRNVETEVHYDYTAKLVSVYRLDTGELVRDRVMTPDELQLEMEIVKAERAKAKLTKIDGGKANDEPQA